MAVADGPRLSRADARRYERSAQRCADRKAGTITAAKFLEQFVEGTPWAHLDIAGTAWFDKAQPNAGKGASGIAVRTLVRLAEGWGS